MHQKSTKKNYHHIWTKFNKFLIKLDRIPDTWEEKVSLYCTFLVSRGDVQSSTLKSYVSAIKTKLKLDGYRWDDELIYFNALTRACKMKNDRQITRLPIMQPFLECVLFEVERKFKIRTTESYLECMYKTAFLLLYYGLFRIGEITQGNHVMKACDIHSSENGNRVLVILHSSKTHSRANRPQRIKIQKDTRMKHFCPVKETIKFADMRRPWMSTDEQFLVFENGDPLLAKDVRLELKEAIGNLRLKPELYDTHSFRIGRATDLRKLGNSVETIKEVGRWKSNAVYKYLRD